MILQPGANCWRVERSNRVAFLIDGAAYFAAFRQALLGAKRSILMAGWDFDSEVRLTPDPAPADGLPTTLLPLLNALCQRRNALSAHVLAWDFSVIYTFEREPLPAIRFAWRGHRRVHFALDAEHPTGASHHQKIVVVDDQVAFVGGLDLTMARWDTPAHEPEDPRRALGNGKIARPMHDVQVAVDGDAAAALGELFRARWLAATGEPLSGPPARSRSAAASADHAWPRDLAPDLEDTEVAIARTVSSTAAAARPCDRAEVREIQALTLRAIGAARRTIYIENQYLTSSAVGHALADRLREPDGPEIILVLPRDQGGWLEQSSMGVLRDRLLAFLRAQDLHDRLRVFYPVIPGLPPDQCMAVHSKVLIVDDDFAKIGSANLSNRSMGLDTECDLAIDASTATTPAQKAKRERAIAGLRTRLLAEHLGVEPSALDARVEETGSLLRAVEALRGGARRLEPLGVLPEPTVHLAVLDGLVCDPEQPVVAEKWLEELFPRGLRKPALRSLAHYAALLAAALAVVAAWRFTPLRELLAIERLVELGTTLRQSPLAPLYVLAAFLVGGLLFFPVTMLIAGTGLVFDPGHGFVYAMAGTLTSACMTFGIGRLLGRPVIDHLLTPRLRHFQVELRRRSFAAMLVARLVPVGQFTAINLLAGALKIRFRAYFFANLVGIVPGTLVLTLFAGQLGHTLQNPRFASVAILTALVGAILASRWLTRRALRNKARAASDLALRQAKES